MGIPSRRRPCLGAGQGQGSMWSTRRLNDMDPCPWSASFRRRRDGVPVQPVTHHFRAQPSLGHPGAEACRRHVHFGQKLGNPSMLPRPGQALTWGQPWSRPTPIDRYWPPLLARVWHDHRLEPPPHKKCSALLAVVDPCVRYPFMLVTRHLGATPAINECQRAHSRRVGQR